MDSGSAAHRPLVYRRRCLPALDVRLHRTTPNGHTKLANLYDISSDYTFKHGLSLGLYFGWAQGGDVIKSIYPANSNGILGFTELNYRF